MTAQSTLPVAFEELGSHTKPANHVRAEGLELVEDPVAGMVNGEWGFKGAKTNQLTHGIHPYPARLVPQVAAKLILNYKGKNALVWDPFCGSGTVLLEATVQGLPSMGTELSPLACLIARAKTVPVAPSTIAKWWDFLLPRVVSNEAQRDRKRFQTDLKGFTLDVNHWFKDAAIRDLGFIRSRIDDARDAGAPMEIIDLFNVAFSYAIRKASYQRPNVWKRYRLPEKDREEQRPDGLGVFVKRLEAIRKMVVSFASKYADSPRPDVVCTDCSTFTPSRPPTLIVTSPPYGDSTTTVAYGQFASLTMEWIHDTSYNWRDIDQKCVGGAQNGSKGISHSGTLERVCAEIKKIDVCRADVARSFFDDMQACMVNFYKVVAPGGHVCLVIGDRTVRQVTVPNAQILLEDAEGIGFEHVETLARRIFFKVRPYRLNPVARSGVDMSVPGIGRENMVVLKRP